MMGRLWRRLVFWWHRDRIEAELREEIETHRALRESALRRRDDVQPEVSSRRVMGNDTLAREDARGVWIAPWCESVLLDSRQGLRSLGRRPAATAAIFLTIAVGTAALTTAVAVAHTVLLKDTPYANAERVVQLLQVRDGRGRSDVAWADIDAIRRAGIFEHVSFAWLRSVSLAGDQLPENARGVYTDAELFPLLGTAPLLGRWPSRTDEQDNTRPVVISHALWQRRYQLDPAAIGSTVHINGDPHVIVAVMPEPFRFPSPYYVWGDLWLLRQPGHPTFTEPTRPMVLSFALLQKGQSRQQAQTRLDAVAASLEEAYPDSHGGVGLRLTEWAASLRRNARPTLLMLLAAAAAVFLIVCINVVNLLLCRGLDRSAELATRVSLGAGGARLVRQLLTETLLLFGAAGLCGIALAAWITSIVASSAPFDIARMREAALTWPIGLIGFIVTMVAGGIVGLVPARRAVRGARQHALTSRSATAHRHGRRMQQSLIAAEIAMATALGCGAVSIAIHASRQAAIDAGFDTTNLVQARMAVPPERYPDYVAEASVLQELLLRLRSHPAIASAAVVDLPPGVAGSAQPAVLLGTDPRPQRVQDLRSAALRVVSDGYFETLRLMPRSGRLLRSGSAESAPVAVVNETFVRTHLDGRDPLTSQLYVTFDGIAALESTPRLVVGVVPDIPEDVLHKPAPPAVYVPVGQGPGGRMAIVARGRQSTDLGTVIREALAATLPNTAVNGLVMPLGELMSSEFARTRASLRMVGALAIVALGLAVVGVYGVIAHGIQHRTREFGIRLALGMTPSGVRRMVLREGAWLLIVGLSLGSVAATWLGPSVRALVVGADQLPVVLALVVVIAILLVTVMAGCDIPARRAARVDPSSALR
ncbi:MAG: ABC transporter permease [Vicinamibacterales bacterium]